jgi:stage II sporulation protein D
VARGTEHPLHAFAYAWIVVDDEDFGHVGPNLPSAFADTWRVRRRGVFVALAVTFSACLSVPVAPTLPAPGFAVPRSVRVQFLEQGVKVVRDVPLEDYVEATAISEFAPPAGDPSLVEQMLEVQAIISRTYAVAHIGRHARDGFDLCSTTHCQLYEPGRLRTSRWAAAAAQAIDRTAGIVLRFEGRPAQALFHADCGGHTSSSGEVWGGEDQPYLASLDDEDVPSDAHVMWQYGASLAELTDALNADQRTHLSGRLESIAVRARDGAGRAERVAITSEGAARRSTTVEVRGEDFRQILSRAFGGRTIRSTWFDLARTDGAYAFSGRGYGHGVGLCQAGALARLKTGATPLDVIARYYPGASLAQSRVK